MEDGLELIKVTAGTDTQGVAKAISYAFQQNFVIRDDEVMLRAMGAGAVNQAVKGIAVARGYMAQRGYDLFVRIGFTDVDVDPKRDPITAMVFRLSLR